MIERNRPRILSTNKQMDDGVFVYSWSIRGWCLGMAKVNALRELMPSVLDRAFKGEL